MASPRVSILIPNFNNGAESSMSGERNFIDDLLGSLVETLEDDPTPLEIIIMDDGSSDDSLETCRNLAQQTWRGGEPFCRLIEAAHCGVLSIVANRLMRESRGEICVRLDGDIVCLTPNWASALCDIFDSSHESLGIVGPLQIAADGFIHSAGDWVLHPRGYHHIAKGADPSVITRSIEVDHVMGCFYCCKRRVWEDVGGYDEELLRGQTVDFGLAARLKGWRAISTPTIRFQHFHAERCVRGTRADTGEGIEYTLNRFEEKWGFNRLAPDLEEVEKRYAGTPLLWNTRFFGPALQWPALSREPLDVNETEWQRFTVDAAYRQVVESRLAVVREMVRHFPDKRRLLHVHARGGLLCHLLTREQFECTGIDQDRHCIDLANAVTARERYPGASPMFLHQGDRHRFPVADGAFDAVLLFDVMEVHPNPVSLLKEAHRVLVESGVLAIVTRNRMSPFDHDWDGLHPYRPFELQCQLELSGLFDQIGNAKDAEGSPLIVSLAVRRADAVKPTGQVESKQAAVGKRNMSAR